MKYVYKIVSAIMALAVIPLSLFSPVVYYRIKSTALQALMYLGQKKGASFATEYFANHDKLPDSFADSLSITGIVNKLKLFSSLSDFSDTADKADEALEIIKAPAVITVVLLSLIIICSIVTAVLAIACKDNRKPVFSSIAGIVLSISFIFSFSALASPVLDGRISLGTLTDMNALVAGLLGNVEELCLTASYYLIPILFAGICIWTFFYNITLPENEKPERKRKLNKNKEKQL